MARALLIGWLWLWSLVTVAAEPGWRPSVFLEGATVARAKALALDAALLKGWHLAESAPDHTLFETLLEEPASPGPLDDRQPPERTLLRIRADFVATPAGVNTYLQAQEVWWAGESGEWSADVTDAYRANLARALESLQKQWVAFYRSNPGRAGRPVVAPRVRVEPGPVVGTVQPLPTGDEPSGAAVRPLPTDGEPARITVYPLPAADTPVAPASKAPPALSETAPVLPARYEVGVWAYYAEQYAREHGCVLGDLGAVLERESGGSELHRVYCADGSTRLVRCDREQCRGGS